MPANNLQKLNSDEIIHLNDTMLAAVAASTPAAYNLTAAQVSTLQNSRNALAASSSAFIEAKATCKAALEDRDAKLAVDCGVTATIVRLITSSPAVTPSMISAAGLSPRSTSRAKIVPKSPTALVTVRQPDGDILLKWGRNGNPYGVVYVVESQVDGGAWTFAGQATATRMAFGGFAPGGTVAFRVYASRNGRDSAFSPVATAYFEAAPAAPALRLAA